MKSYSLDGFTNLAGRLCLLLLLGMLVTPLARAAPQDLPLPCTGATVHTFSFDEGDTPPDEYIFAVPVTAGDVFWELSLSSGNCTPPISPGCTPMSCACANGLNIALPTGAPDASVSSALPVVLSATTPLSVDGVDGPMLFSLTATLEDDPGTPEDESLQTCQKFIQVEVQAPKVPFDIVFVLDRSGSMKTTIAGSVTRWEALKEGVENFLTTIATTSCTGSRFGMTLFATTDLPNSSYPESLQDIAIGTALATNVMAELDHTDHDPPSGWTAMGQGLQDGIGKFDDDTRPRIVMLFSDGAQNRPPEVLPGGTTYEYGPEDDPDDDPPPPPFPVAPGGSGLFKIVSVGIDSANASYHMILQELAIANDGGLSQAFYSTDIGTDITASLETAIDAVLATCSAQTVAKYAGTLSGSVDLPAFEVNRQVDQLLIRLSYNQELERQQLEALLSEVQVLKDNTDITNFFERIIVGKSSRTALLRTGFERSYPDTGRIPSDGRYVIRMAKPSGMQQDLDYRVVPYSDDHRLDMEWNVSPASPRVDEPFTPAIKLTWLGQPVLNATVEAAILEPGEDLGDLLARNPQTVDPSGQADAGSPGYQKYLYLLENDPAFRASLLPAEQRVTLTPQGEGLYSGSYNPGDVSGVYQVIYFVTAEDPAFGKLQRMAAQSVYTRFGDIDLEDSSVSDVVRPPKGDIKGGVSIDIRPKTTNGRFIGPAQGDAFSVIGADIVLSSIDDRQDGSYTLTLTGNPNAEIVLNVLGEKIYQGKASGIGAVGILDKICNWFESLGLPCWLGWVLIVLIIVVIIVVVSRSRNP